MEAIKANIIEVLGNSQYKIALQIAETIYLISKKEFPEKWRSLAKTLAINLKGDPCYYERELVSLKTMLKIFKKYVNLK